MTTPVVIEVVSPGAYASVQDFGRRGYRRVGVPWSGVLDARLMRIANALAGNHAGTPVIECFDGGLLLAARGGAVRLAVAGDAVIEHDRGDQRVVLSAWRSLTLGAGDTLRLRRVERARVAVVAVEGLSLPLVLGSASTFVRAALGGVDGRALAAGVRLPAASAGPRREQWLPDPPQPAPGAIRIVAGPQADHFAAETLAAFVDADYRVSSDADRMGVRLEGPALLHQGPAEIVSDATVPGAIQVPGNGQPIVLLNDAQTAGGYPKIATVVSADLPRLAACASGARLRFTWVDAAAGEQLARAAEAELLVLLASMRPLPAGGVDLAALYACNLISGVVDGMPPGLARA